MLDGTTVLRMTATNHRVWFRRCAAVNGGGVERCDGLDLIVVGQTGTLAFPRTRWRSGLDDVMRRAGELGLHTMACWSLDEDRALGTLLLARGFEWGWQPHWMALDLTRLAGDELEHEVVPATGTAHRELPYAGSLLDPPAVRRLAVLANGEMIGHVAVNPWRGFAGIYDMGVVPGRRRHGIGRALTLSACRLARDLGCDHAGLNATEEGELLYRTVGFESLGKGRTWWLHPGPRPTPRQSAFVECIGFGDVEGLASLRLTQAELEEPIRGGGTPLAVAVVTGQVAVAEWILRRRPDLVSRPVEPRGGTLLHAAVEWDNEPLVRVALAHGADRTVRDHTWNGTALQWAEHLGRSQLAALLRP